MDNKITFIDVTPENVTETGIFCIKNRNATGYQKKVDWFCNKLNRGIKIVIAQDSDNKQIGFIEYLPIEIAWRPIIGMNYMFIQCIGVFSTKHRNMNIGSELINICEHDAHENRMLGLCSVSSDGPWMAKKDIFLSNGFKLIEEADRFQLVEKKFTADHLSPRFIKWHEKQKEFAGWHLIYADQCPWHESSVDALKDTSKDFGIKLNIRKINSPKEAKNSPAGFGVFCLIHDGKILADHYISNTRFENILRKELN